MEESKRLNVEGVLWMPTGATSIYCQYMTVCVATSCYICVHVLCDLLSNVSCAVFQPDHLFTGRRSEEETEKVSLQKGNQQCGDCQ